MMGNLSSERSIDVSQAIEIAYRWARQADIECQTETVYVSQSTSSITVNSSLLRDGRVLSQASGKGMGDAALASAIFEAIEHAAIRKNLYRAIPPLRDAQLPRNKKIEAVDLGYKLARELRYPDTQPVEVFYELREDLSLNLDAPHLYPRILADLSLPIGPYLGDLIPLSAYSTNTGTAAGTNWRDAILHGLNEVLERDAESQFLLDVNMGHDSWRHLVLKEHDPLRLLLDELTIKRGKNGALLLLDSQAGFVVCAMSEPEPGGEAELGFGASQSLRIAVERAVTELQQIRSSIMQGSTWADNGASAPNGLDGYPNMKKLASRLFAIPKCSSEPIEVPEDVDFVGSPVSQLKSKGYLALGRLVWSDTVYLGSIVVAQALVPGLETLNNLIFNRPILPLGRLRSAANVDFLLEGAVNDSVR